MVSGRCGFGLISLFCGWRLSALTLIAYGCCFSAGCACFGLRGLGVFLVCAFGVGLLIVGCSLLARWCSVVWVSGTVWGLLL